MLPWILFGIGAIIIVGLGIYAGRLLFLLQSQQKRQLAARNKRIENITQSIRTIAFAMEQQQCDPSEGAIRICNLLGALPILPLPDFKAHYPVIFELYERIKHFPVLEERNALTKQERRKQDREREQIEAEISSRLQKELVTLKTFTVD